MSPYVAVTLQQVRTDIGTYCFYCVLFRCYVCTNCRVEERTWNFRVEVQVNYGSDFGAMTLLNFGKPRTAHS